VTYAGNPRFWVIAAIALSVRREDHRKAFAADPARFLKEASRAGRRCEQTWRSRLKDAAADRPRR
jgi:hypothetical protein